jgi:L-cystine transport system permease protein
MNFSVQGFAECLLSGLRYLPNTLIMAVVSLGLGLVFGTIIAIVRFFKVPVLSKILAVFVTVYNGIPLIVALMVYNLLFLLRFDAVAAALGLPLTTADVPTIWVGVFALTLAATCSISESMRGALLSIDKGQFDAGYSVSMTTRQLLLRIILPQVVPVAIPMLLNTFIGMMKGTSVVLKIGITDVLNGAILPCQMTYSFLVGYLAAAAIYWTLSILIENLAKFAQRRVDKTVPGRPDSVHKGGWHD